MSSRKRINVCRARAARYPWRSGNLFPSELWSEDLLLGGGLEVGLCEGAQNQGKKPPLGAHPAGNFSGLVAKS